MNFPGKLLTNTEATNYLNNKFIERCLPDCPPKINYNRDRVETYKLPLLVVYIAAHKSYYLMNQDEFLSDKVQTQVLKERADYYGSLADLGMVSS